MSLQLPVLDARKEHELWRRIKFATNVTALCLPHAMIVIEDSTCFAHRVTTQWPAVNVPKTNSARLVANGLVTIARTIFVSSVFEEIMIALICRRGNLTLIRFFSQPDNGGFRDFLSD